MRLERARASILTCFLAGCAATPTGEDEVSPPDEPTTVPTDNEGWEQAVAAEAARLEAEHAGAGVRIVVVDLEGKVLAQHGAVDEILPTGSSVKPLMTLVGIQTGVSPDDEFDCEGGEVEVDGVRFYDAQPRDVVTLRRALADSSNVAMVKLALKVNWEVLYSGVSSFVSLPEPSGMSRAEGIAMLFGATTRLALADLAEAYSATLQAPEGATLLELLEFAVEDGTGKSAAREGVYVAGKTGTAEVDGRYHAVFVGMVGTGEPQAVVGVAVDGLPEGGYGSTVAAPAVGNLAAAIYGDGSNTAPHSAPM